MNEWPFRTDVLELGFEKKTEDKNLDYKLGCNWIGSDKDAKVGKSLRTSSDGEYTGWGQNFGSG